MKARFGGKGLIIILGLFLFFGCQSIEEVSTSSEDALTRSSPNLRLRIAAPAEVQSVMVEVRAIEVDTGGFGSSFDILQSQEVIPRDEFETTEEVVIAIQPGTVEVRVYAFATEISPLGTDNVNDAIYFGQTESFSVGVGEERSITVEMFEAQNIEFQNVEIVQTGDQYSVQFQTSQSLPADTEIQILYNNVNPDFLEFAEQENESVTANISGDNHSVLLSSTTIPSFAKIELSAIAGGQILRGETTVFCAVSVCGSLPLALYDRKIALVDDTSLTQGLTTSWKTTSLSSSGVYFSKSFFDQLFLLQQIGAGFSTESLGIYRAGQVSFDPANPGSLALCPGSACLQISPTTITDSGAPANFFDDVQVVMSTQVTQDLTNGAFYPNTANCTEDLSRLGQDCSRVPRVDTFFLEDNRLFMDVFLGTNATLEFYLKTDVASGPVTSLALNLPEPDTAGGKVRSTGIDYQTVLNNLGADYLGRVVNDSFAGSWLDLNVSNWVDFSGTINALTTLPTLSNIGQIQGGSTLYYAITLEAGRSYDIKIEGAGGALNLWEAYVIAPDAQTILKSLGLSLLGSNIPEKTSITVTPTSTGVHYLKLVNPLVFPLLFIVEVE